jgi:hypothetical protein
MAISIQELFQDSAALYPQGGARLSPAECAFVLAELDSIVEKYDRELKDEAMSDTLRRMVEHHVAGLRFITESVRAGMSNKPRAD